MRGEGCKEACIQLTQQVKDRQLAWQGGYSEESTTGRQSNSPTQLLAQSQFVQTTTRLFACHLITFHPKIMRRSYTNKHRASLRSHTREFIIISIKVVVWLATRGCTQLRGCTLLKVGKWAGGRIVKFSSLMYLSPVFSDVPTSCFV